jgi:hypothetical protein
MNQTKFLQSFMRFLIFASISGLGWVLDMITFTFLLSSGVESYTANFISSFVGVTFVWFTSLKAVFKSNKNAFSKGILIYWLFQVVSIFVYSLLIGHLTLKLNHWHVSGLNLDMQQFGILAKIIVTPLNLFTNYLFMKKLVSIINSHKKQKGMSIK